MFTCPYLNACYVFAAQQRWQELKLCKFLVLAQNDIYQSRSLQNYDTKIQNCFRLFGMCR